MTPSATAAATGGGGGGEERPAATSSSATAKVCRGWVVTISSFTRICTHTHSHSHDNGTLLQADEGGSASSDATGEVTSAVEEEGGGQVSSIHTDIHFQQMAWSGHHQLQCRDKGRGLLCCRVCLRGGRVGGAGVEGGGRRRARAGEGDGVAPEGVMPDQCEGEGDASHNETDTDVFAHTQ